MQRKPTTIQDYRIILGRHLGPFFGGTEIAKLTANDVIAYIGAKRRASGASNWVNSPRTVSPVRLSG